MTMKKQIASALKITIPLIVGVLLLWLTYRRMDFGSIAAIIRSGVNYPIILGSLFLGVGSNVLRGYRWQLLIEPLIPNEPPTRNRNAVYTSLGSYAINMALPRAGEVWRCAKMGRYEKISFSRLLGTLFTERVVDLVMLGLILLSMMVGAGSFFGNFFRNNPDLMNRAALLLTSVSFYVGLFTFFGIVFGFYYYMKLHHPQHCFTQFVLRLAEGIKSILHLKKAFRFILYSLLIWLGYFLYFYVTFFAFDFTRDLGIGVGLIAFAMSALAVIVPVQGGIGPWHFMVISALTAFGITREDAGAFALIVHTLQTLGTIIAGIIAIFLLPLANKDYIRVSKDSMIH